MSTKIYDGMIATNTNVFKAAAGIRSVVEPMFMARLWAAVKKAEDHVGENWNEVFDLFGKQAENWKHPIPRSSYEVVDSLYKLIMELQKSPQHTFSDLDFGYDVILLPNGRGLKHPPLVVLFSEDSGNEYRKALVDAGVVSMYGYWNNSDHDDDVTDEEWKEREKAWSKLNVPAEDGLGISQPTRISVQVAHMDKVAKERVDAQPVEG